MEATKIEPVEQVVEQKSVKPTHPEKLTQEEETARLLFIGKCVDKNKTYPNTSRFGSQVPLTVQDMSNSNIKTLQTIGSYLKKAAGDVDPEFSDNSEGLKISGIAAEEWINFIRLTIKKKKHQEWATDQNAKRRSLKASIDAAKTPQELRTQAEEELKALGEEEEID